MAPGRPLYHRLDPWLERLPWPYRARFSVRRFGEVSIVRMARDYLGVELMPVHCFAVGDTLIDTGVAGQGEAITRFARDAGIARALVTHHHEDHAGNADRLGREGVAVRAGRATRAILARDLPIRFYQHFLWGKAPRAEVGLLDEAPRVGALAAVVVPAPGHCVDQIAFHVPERGWLFSGDAFIHERVKLFRRDEDFAATVATLERFLALDFDVLFCAHRPRLTRGKQAIAEKLAWLRDVEGRTRALHAEGRSEIEIARRVLPRAGALSWITLGDASPENLVRSILHGPTPRPEVIEATSALATPEGA